MNRIFSKLLNEYLNVADDESATFDSGVVYSADEIRMIKRTGASPADILAIHNVKTVFGGDVEYCGHFDKKTTSESLPVKPTIKKTIEIEPIQLSLFNE